MDGERESVMDSGVVGLARVEFQTCLTSAEPSKEGGAVAPAVVWVQFVTNTEVKERLDTVVDLRVEQDAAVKANNGAKVASTQQSIQEIDAVIGNMFNGQLGNGFFEDLHTTTPWVPFADQPAYKEAVDSGNTVVIENHVPSNALANRLAQCLPRGLAGETPGAHKAHKHRVEHRVAAAEYLRNLLTKHDIMHRPLTPTWLAEASGEISMLLDLLVRGSSFDVAMKHLADEYADDPRYRLDTAALEKRALDHVQVREKIAHPRYHEYSGQDFKSAWEHNEVPHCITFTFTDDVANRQSLR